MVSLGIINGTRSRTWDITWWKTAHGIRTVMPHAMRDLGYSPFADLRGKEVSVKPANWDIKLDPDYRSIVGAELNSVDLREADLTSAFLANAVLNHAHLEDANLLSADLAHAQLIDSHLEGADLLGANLKGVQGRGVHLAGADLTLANLTGARLGSADLSDATLTGATLSQADLTYADLRNAKVTADQLKDAQHMELAYMSDDLEKSLRFDADHNAVVKASQDKEKIDPKDAESDELARLDSLSGLPGGDAAAEALRGQLRFRNPVLTLAPAEADSSKSYNVKQLMELYDFPDLDGQGQTIGIIELGGGFKKSDLAAYFAQMGISAPDVTTKLIDGGQNSPSTPNSADSEVQLNIEVAGTIAPKAKIVVYFTVNTDKGYIDAVKAAVEDAQNHPSVITTGWGGPESSWSRESIQAFDMELHRAADAGITFIAGAGDNGPTDGVTEWQTPCRLSSLQPMGACGWWHNVSNRWNGYPVGNFMERRAQRGVQRNGRQQCVSAARMAKRNVKVGKEHPRCFDKREPCEWISGFDRRKGNGHWRFVRSRTHVVRTGVHCSIRGLGKNIGYSNPTLYKTIGASDGFNPVPRGPGIPSKPGWTPQSGWGTPG